MAQRGSLSGRSPFCQLSFFFGWKLHGSTRFRAVALLSAKRSEKESSKMIVGANKLCMLCNNTKTCKKHGTNRGKERRQPQASQRVSEATA